MKAETQPHSIVSRYEVAAIVGVTRQGVGSVIKHPNFPPPICSVGKNNAPLFYRRDVENFKLERDVEAKAAREQAAAA